jgi:hypothetical protein
MFFRVSTPTVPEPELTSNMFDDSRAAWPLAAQSLSWRSYLRSFSDGPVRTGGVCVVTTSVMVGAGRSQP